MENLEIPLVNGEGEEQSSVTQAVEQAPNSGVERAPGQALRVKSSNKGDGFTIEGFQDTEDERTALWIFAGHLRAALSHGDVKPDPATLTWDELWTEQGAVAQGEGGQSFSIKAKYVPEQGHQVLITIHNPIDNSSDGLEQNDGLEQTGQVFSTILEAQMYVEPRLAWIRDGKPVAQPSKEERLTPMEYYRKAFTLDEGETDPAVIKEKKDAAVRMLRNAFPKATSLAELEQAAQTFVDRGMKYEQSETIKIGLDTLHVAPDIYTPEVIAR